jgi:hypothetical protein
MSSRRTYTGRYGALLLLPTGVLCVAVAIAVPFLLSPSRGEDPLIGVIFGTVPALTGGLLALLNGWAAAATRIVLSEEGVSVRAPTWRATPLPPMHRLEAPWSEVRAVLRRVEIYRLWIPFPVDIPVPVYQVRSGLQQVTLGGRIVLRLPQAMREIAERAGRPIIELEPIEVRMLRSLRAGTPPWEA